MTPTRTLLASCITVFVAGLAVPSATVQAQTAVYGGISIGGYASSPAYGGYVSRPAYQPTYSGGYAPAYRVYQPSPSVYAPSYAPAPTYSPAQRQGYAEGRLYYETGIAPNHILTPAESRGFIAGESRQAQQPWQLDPARQQGYQEGLYYWETGLRPNRPLSPAEQQGFIAGERRAANRYARPW